MSTPGRGLDHGTADRLAKLCGLFSSDHAGERAAARQFSAHDFARIELRARAAYLKRRIAIATVKQEHGLLTEQEQDDLVHDGAELKADVELWKQYR